MGTAHKFICRLGAMQSGFKLRLALPTTIVCAFLLIPATQATAFDGTVNVEKTGPGAASSTIISEPMGIDCGSECSHEFPTGFGGVTVQLTAAAGSGYVLGGWSGVTCTGGPRSNPCEFTVGIFSLTNVEASFIVQPPPPTVSTGESSEVGPHSAMLEGSVNPQNGEVEECYFEYGRSTGYGLTAPCTPADPGSGISTVEVTASLPGLAAETTYHYRLVAVGLGGTVRGEDRSFTTEPAPPAVSVQAPEYTQTLAHLRDLVNPERSLTTYYFRFGSTTSYGQDVPVTAASAGSGEASVSISQIVTGLTPGVTYHYRLVATNPHGATTGPDQTFTALTPLPDNRAYEMVTPPFKSFGNLVPGGQAIATTSTTAISSSGSQLLEKSISFLGTGAVGADEELLGTSYALERGASEWTTTPLTAPASVFPISHEELASPADPAVGLWAAATPSQPDDAEDFYLREANGHYINIGPMAPPSATQGPPHGAEAATKELGKRGIVGASTDLADVVFQMESPEVFAEPSFLWPGDLTEHNSDGLPSLYEYVGAGHTGEGADVPSLVGVDNANAQISECGTGLGADTGAEPHVVRNGISDGGSTVFFNAQSSGSCTGTGPAVSQVYARIGLPGATQTTVNVAGAAAAATNAVQQVMVSATGGNYTLTATTVTGAGTLSVDSPTITEVASDNLAVFHVGDAISGAGIPAGATITAVGHDTLTISANAEVLEPQRELLTATETTAAIAWNAPAKESEGSGSLEAALHALPGVGAVSVSGGPGDETGTSPYVITFSAGPLAGIDVAPLTSTSSLTGGSPESTALVTVMTEGSASCATSASCNVTSPVTFQGASSDGSKVFFTTEQALLGSDEDTTNDIYECELPGDKGATPAPSGVVNACPDLKAISVTGTSSGANVQSVVAISEEGSHVYFIATGVLTGAEENHNHEQATEGDENLYVYEPDPADPGEYKTAFIGMLPTGSIAEAQATPSGEYLVFTTTADLTPDDKSTVNQAFRYDAQTGELVRVSVGQNGFDNDGNTYENPASIADTNPELGRLTVSDDGSYVVFQSNDALTPQVRGGKHNVYEWHAGNVYLISDGADPARYAGLIGIDASGENIFFTTADKLVAQDTDEDVDVYDARVDGGFPEPAPAVSCSGEACQGPHTAPPAPTGPGSTGAPVIGNVAPGSAAGAPKKATVKSLTNAQKLSKALKACRKDKSRSKRAACEKAERKKYGAGSKAKRKKAAKGRGR